MYYEKVNEKELNDFRSKIVTILNNSMMGLMISIGYQTELFDKLSTLPPSTIPEIAQSTGLHQRYLQEWLHCMVVGDIISYDPTTKKFLLPKEHAMVISRQAGHNNLASYSQWIKSLGSVEDKVIDCFRNGGGVGYEYYSEFLAQTAHNSKLKYNALLTKKIIPQIPEMYENLTKGIDVLDVGCGYGYSTNIIAKSFPKSTVTGIDISEESILIAKDDAKKLQLQNVIFNIKSVERLNEKEKYNLITAFDLIHDTKDPLQVLKSIYESLENNGLFLMVDIKASSNVEENKDHPLAPFLYSVSTLHCLTVSLAQNGMGLGTVWGKQKALELLERAGFDNVKIIEIEDDALNCYFFAKKSE